MKKSELKQLIKEEIHKVLGEIEWNKNTLYSHPNEIELDVIQPHPLIKIFVIPAGKTKVDQFGNPIYKAFKGIRKKDGKFVTMIQDKYKITDQPLDDKDHGKINLETGEIKAY